MIINTFSKFHEYVGFKTSVVFLYSNNKQLQKWLSKPYESNFCKYSSRNKSSKVWLKLYIDTWQILFRWCFNEINKWIKLT